MRTDINKKLYISLPNEMFICYNSIGTKADLVIYCTVEINAWGKAERHE